MIILAIDPGSTHSGYALIDGETRRPINVGKTDNDLVFGMIRAGLHDRIAIEMIASYGMAVGAEVFQTCVWIGRFVQHNAHMYDPATCELVFRREVKLHHCHNAGAKDSNVTQALIDRFASGVRNRGKGTKSEPGWFYGFAGDMWAAYALAVLVADTHGTRGARQ